MFGGRKRPHSDRITPPATGTSVRWTPATGSSATCVVVTLHRG